MATIRSYGAAAPDDSPQYVIRRDITGGVNTRSHGTLIADTQVTGLINVDLSIPGQASLRQGTQAIQCLATTGSMCFGFNPDGGTNTAIVLNQKNLYSYDGSTVTLRATSVSLGSYCYGLKIGESGLGDVLAIQDGVNLAWRMKQDYSIELLSNASSAYQPPISRANLYYRNRWWIFKSNNLYWSDAYSSDYSQAFDQDNDFYRIPCGTERAILGLRDEGIICFGEDEVWGVNPSIVPAATDKPTKIVEYGCIAPRTVVQVGDEIYYLSRDGVRGLFRSQQDKLQSKTSYPLSYPLKDELDGVGWANIEKAVSIFFDNKYLIALPYGASYNNRVWAYYPATNGWSVWTGWNVGDWCKVRIGGQEKLYYIDSVNGNFVRADVPDLYTDLGLTIDYIEQGRKEDVGQPLITKSGGEVYVKLLGVGATTVKVYAEFDDGGYNFLGNIDVTNNGITFPVTFPVLFRDAAVIAEKFHIDSYGEFKTIRIKIERSTTGDSSQVVVLERGAVTYVDEYIPEEVNI